jgi:hypothetical protein
MFGLSGQGLPSAIYVAARNLGLSNRSTNRQVVLDISLGVKVGTDEKVYKRALLAMPQQPMVGLEAGPRILLRSLSERPLAPLVTIAPLDWKSGSIAFSLPYPGSEERASEMARLRSCEFSLIIRDTLSGQDLRYSIRNVVVDDDV